MYDNYGREIYQELQKLNANFSAFTQFFETWGDRISGYWDQLLSFLPSGLWFLVALVGVCVVLKLFFPRWRDV